MAATVASAKRAVHRYYQKYLIIPGSGGLNEDDQQAFLHSLAIVKRSPAWRGPLKFTTGVEQQPCEHCLKGGKQTVLLTMPAIVSGHPRGDWVCEDCDPRVASEIYLESLTKLVGAE